MFTGSTIPFVSSDGDRLFVASFDRDEGDEIPDWLDTGVLIPASELKPRISFLDKLKNGTAVISFATGSPMVMLSDTREDCVFRMTPVIADFPDYQKFVIDKTVGAFSREVATDFQPVGYTAGYLKEVGAMAKVLESDYVRMY